MLRHLFHIAAFIFALCLLTGAPRAISAEADAQTRAIVEAADSFLATLDASQRRQAVYPWSSSEQRRNWSNLPEGPVRRGGVKWGDLNTQQRAALMRLLGAVLSEDGVDMVRLQMRADEVIAQRDRRPNLGENLYFISFLGEPSATSPWMLQFGGHHLAINATLFGPDLTLSPTLTGGQPLRFEADGRRVFLTENEINAAHALMASLSAEQRAQALVSPQRAQMQLGPGQDGRTLAAEGVQVSTLNATQRARLTALIEARLGILNANDRAPLLRDIAAHYDETRFGWWGPVAQGEPAYWRITGPSLVLEYSPQDAEHVHSIYRNPQNDYGAAWSRN